jgi:hypothetical protein
VTALGLAFAAAVVSGAAALVYEVVWLRTLSLVVGHAVDALTAVLAACMAGLAVGALLSGRLAERLRRHAAGSTAADPATPTSLEPQNVEFRGALARLRGGTLSR